MMRSMFAGVTGLRNHQIRMDVIGNNIANVNTVGYKGGRVNFQDTLNQVLRGASAPQGDRGGINALQVGLGMTLASIDIVQTQGNLQNTGKITDVAVQGDGFFILSDGMRQYYTRAGNFNLEADGWLTNPSNGLILQGWLADANGDINTNTPVDGIRLPIGQTIAPIATTSVEFGGNMDSETNSELSYASMNISDGPHAATVELELIPVGFNQFQYNAIVSNGSITGGTNGSGIITLNLDGSIANVSGADFQVTPTGSGASPITIHVPRLNTPDGGSFISDKAISQTLNLSPTFAGAGTYTSTVDDEQGNSMTLTYDVVLNGGNTYDWTITGVAGGALAPGSASTGSFDWTLLSGISNATGKVVVRSTAAALDVTIDSSPNAPGYPSFRVVTKEGEFPSTFAAAKSLVTTTRVYDSLGQPHTLTTTVTKSADNAWSWETVDDANNPIGNGDLLFSNAGALVGATGGPLTFVPAGANPISIMPDFTEVTQYASQNSEITSPFQDGFPMGQLQNFNIDKVGNVVGVFSNGMNQVLGQIALANFTNPAGLMRSGETMFEESSNSGSAQVGQAGQNGRGLITPGAIEMSNVDLSQEFTDMIVTQRGFQANSKIITTSDEMLQELVNLKR